MASTNPKPTALKMIQGNPGKRALPKNEPMPAPVAADLKPSKDLSPAAKAIWIATLPLLTGMRVMTVADVPALEIYCKAFAEEKHAEKMLDAEGWDYKNGWYKIRNDAMARRIKLINLFGMTPSDRTKVKTVSAPKKANPFKA